MEKIPYVKTLKAVYDGAAILYVMDNTVLSGTWLFVHHLTVEDVTTFFNLIRVGQGTDEFDVHWWEDRPVPAAGVLYEFKEMFFVPEGHRIIVEFSGTAAADRLFVKVDGYTIEKMITGRRDRPRPREA